MKRSKRHTSRTSPEVDPVAFHAVARRRGRRLGGAITALIAGGAAYVSYTHGLYVAHWVGNTGPAAFVVAALPDGLIAISTVSLYQEARETGLRPPWAMVGLCLGIGLTVVMNVAAGTRHGWGGALVAAMVPVVLLLALEILTGVVRRGRGAGGHGPSPAALVLPDSFGATGATEGQPPREWLDSAILTLRTELSERATADALGISRNRVAAAAEATPGPGGPDRPQDELALNGSGRHE